MFFFNLQMNVFNIYVFHPQDKPEESLPLRIILFSVGKN